jgi:inner membrane protein
MIIPLYNDAMATIISHPAVLMVFYPTFSRYQFLLGTWIAAAICSIVPDFDVIGFQLGIQYGDILGHRGLTHSILFAFLLSAIVAVIIQQKEKIAAFLFLFVCTLSHGILDALTDGGLGIAFLSPFSNTRYFFPWRPLEVSPIGISGFLSDPALSVLMTEIKFIWIPCVLIFLIGRGLKWRNTKQ